jgi:hypothetical protein
MQCASARFDPTTRGPPPSFLSTCDRVQANTPGCHQGCREGKSPGVVNRRRNLQVLTMSRAVQHFQLGRVLNGGVSHAACVGSSSLLAAETSERGAAVLASVFQ